MIPDRFGVYDGGSSLARELSNRNQSLGVGSVVVEGALRVGILDTWGLKVSMAWQQYHKQQSYEDIFHTVPLLSCGMHFYAVFSRIHYSTTASTIR